MGLEEEQLSEEDIQKLLESLDTPLVTTKPFVIELMTSPYVTFSEELVMEIAENLGKCDEIIAPVALLDLQTGDLCACFIVESMHASDAVVVGSEIFKNAAQQAGILLEGFDVIHCYPEPVGVREMFEDEEEGGV